MIKQFVKALDVKGYCFNYNCRRTPNLGIEKLKGTHDPHIRRQTLIAKLSIRLDYLRN